MSDNLKKSEQLKKIASEILNGMPIIPIISPPPITHLSKFQQVGSVLRGVECSETLKEIMDKWSTLIKESHPSFEEITDEKSNKTNDQRIWYDEMSEVSEDAFEYIAKKVSDNAIVNQKSTLDEEVKRLTKRDFKMEHYVIPPLENGYLDEKAEQRRADFNKMWGEVRDEYFLNNHPAGSNLQMEILKSLHPEIIVNVDYEANHEDIHATIRRFNMGVDTCNEENNVSFTVLKSRDKCGFKAGEIANNQFVVMGSGCESRRNAIEYMLNDAHMATFQEKDRAIVDEAIKILDQKHIDDVMITFDSIITLEPSPKPVDEIFEKEVTSVIPKKFRRRKQWW